MDKLFPARQPCYIPADTRPTTDDWPFFYLRSNFIPREYAITLLMIVLISGVMVFAGNVKTKVGIDLHFLLLGCAFMLLETKSITSLAVLFGSTWIINSLVIFSILIMILLANLLILKVGEIKVEYCYALLGAAIILNYFVPLRVLFFNTIFIKVALSGLMVSLPIFFAGMIFANSFSKSKDPDFSLGSNILGGVMGGVLEYQSLITGFNFLFVLAFLIYLFSYLVIKKKVS
jgi:hypothetical protein